MKGVNTVGMTGQRFILDQNGGQNGGHNGGQSGGQNELWRWSRRQGGRLLASLPMIALALALPTRAATPPNVSGLFLTQPTFSTLPDTPRLGLMAQVSEIAPITQTGELTSADETLPDGSYGQLQSFDGVAGQSVNIDLISDDFDAYLLLLDPEGELVAQDDDGGEGLNARLSLTLAVTGIYQIVVNTANAAEVGQYQLSVTPATAEEGEIAAATTLNNQVLALYEAGRFSEALPLAMRVLEIRQRLLGSQHPEVAIAINNIAEMNRALGNLAEAEPLYQQALAIQESTLDNANDPAIALTLNNLSLIYLQQGRYREAEPFLQRALEIFSAQETSVLRVRVLNNLGELNRQTGQFEAAVLYYQQALDLSEQLFGENSLDIARTSSNLALAEQARGNFAESERLLDRSIRITQTLFGDTHPDLALALLNLGALYQTQTRYAESEALFQQALEIQQANYGDNHPDLVSTLGSFGQLYQIQGLYDQAETSLQQALAIASASVGPESPLAATIMTRLAEVYRLAGRYGEAETTGLKTLNLQAQVLGTSHPDYATTLNNLALVYIEQGRYPEATPLFEQAVATLETSFGAQHPAVALTLNNWGELYRNQGDYAAALPLYRRALAIQEASLSANHPDRATTLNNLSLVAYQTGDLENAIDLLEETARLFESSLGPDHPNLGLILNNLAESYRNQGNVEAALPIFTRALAIQQKALLPNHPNIGLTLNNLGLLHFAKKEIAQAEANFQQALDIFRSSLGDKHPNVALALQNLGLLAQHRGNTPEALKYLEQGQEIEDYNLNLVLSTGSEATKAAYLRSLPRTSHYVSFHLQTALDDDDAARLSLLAILRRKGRVLDAVTDNLKSLRNRLNPSDQTLLEDWAKLRSQLATLIVAGLGSDSPDIYQNKVNTLEQQIQTLEKDLGNRSSEFRNEAQAINLKTVQNLIPDQGALLEFIVYQPVAPEQIAGNIYGPARYGVYLLKPSGELFWRDLGETAVIDAQIETLRRLLQGRSNRYRPAAKALYNSLLAPLQSELANIDHLLISPDGQLNLMPFAALRNDENQYLLETHQITYLTSGRDLLRLQNTTVSDRPTVLVANPNYESADSRNDNNSAPSQVASQTRGNQRAADLNTLSFGPLVGTAVEAREIAGQVTDALVLTGSGATENALKQLQAPRILHIATHGFFLQDTEEAPAAWGAQPFSSRGASAFSTLTDPLLRSGLALAGFNNRQSGVEDGVLTALEAASLDLNGTQLVVLSACETGVGEASNGEGVFGLRRAFVMAGAQTQILSLWRVDDDATKDLMVGYYNRLQANQGRSAGLRDMQLELLNSDNYSHPYFWAAFIPSGDWRGME